MRYYIQLSLNTCFVFHLIFAFAGSSPANNSHTHVVGEENQQRQKVPGILKVMERMTMSDTIARIMFITLTSNRRNVFIL